MTTNKNICCIYKITNSNFDIYIGQTINFKRRCNSYSNFLKLKNQKRLKYSFVKYGFENHKIEILLECNHDELNFWEEFYVALFDSFKSEHGLNSTSGGRSHKRMLGVPKSEDWKNKISKAHIGKKRAEFSQEWKDNISKAHKGMPRTESWIENLKSAAIKRKNENRYIISETQKEKFRVSYSKYMISEKGIEQRKKTSELTSKRFSIPILQYTNDGVFVKKWDSMRKAAKELNIGHPSIVNCANNKYKSAGGFVWKRDTELEQIKNKV